MSKQTKVFIEYLNDMDDIYKNIEEYNPNKKGKILTAFDDMIANMVSNKKLNPIVSELFIKGTKHFPCFNHLIIHQILDLKIENDWYYFCIR